MHHTGRGDVSLPEVVYHSMEGVSLHGGCITHGVGGESPEGGVPPRGEKVHSGEKGGHPSGGVRRVHPSGECHPTPDEGYSLPERDED